MSPWIWIAGGAGVLYWLDRRNASLGSAALARARETARHRGGASSPTATGLGGITGRPGSRESSVPGVGRPPTAPLPPGVAAATGAGKTIIVPSGNRRPPAPSPSGGASSAPAPIPGRVTGRLPGHAPPGGPLPPPRPTAGTETREEYLHKLRVGIANARLHLARADEPPDGAWARKLAAREAALARALESP